MKGILYQLTFKNDKSYIGITSKSIECRCKGHIKGAAANSKMAISCAIRKYGEDFNRKVLVVGEIDYLKELEIKAIAKFGTLAPGGYNLSLGGDISPMHNPEIAAKVSAKMMDKDYQHPMKRPEQRERMKGNSFGIGNKASSGEKMSKSFCEAVSARLIGNQHKKGKAPSEKQRKEHSDWMKLNNPMKKPEIAAKSLATRLANADKEMS